MEENVPIAYLLSIAVTGVYSIYMPIIFRTKLSTWMWLQKQKSLGGSVSVQVDTCKLLTGFDYELASIAMQLQSYPVAFQLHILFYLSVFNQS